jgi:hypothetical protein
MRVLCVVCYLSSSNSLWSYRLAPSRKLRPERIGDSPDLLKLLAGEDMAGGNVFLYRLKDEACRAQFAVNLHQSKPVTPGFLW